MAGGRHESSLDDRGRVTIRPEYRRFLGKRFVQILMPDGIHLFPVPAKPDWPGKLPQAKDARRLALEAAEKEIEEEEKALGEAKDARKR